MEKQKYIFDVDGTILLPNWKEENMFFKANLSIDNIQELLEKKRKLLMDYEKTHERYCINELVSHFAYYGYPLSTDFINKWISFTANDMNSDVSPGMEQLLHYLYRNNRELIVLSNWITSAQRKRLERLNLLKYFRYIYGGDTILKPNKDSYRNACGVTPIEDCLMIGDDLEKDYEGALSIGLDAILITEDNREEMIRKLMVKEWKN